MSVSKFEKGDRVKIYDRIIIREGVIDYVNEEKQQASILLDDGSKLACGYSFKQLELIERPKKKVKLYQWAHKGDDGRWRKTIVFYFATEEECRNHVFPKGSDVELIRLDHTMIEVDDE